MTGTVLEGCRVVTGVIGDDIHVVGIRLLEHALRSAGATVHPLGVLTPPDDFAEAAAETAAHAVLVSSSNGHAAMWCPQLRPALERLGIGGTLVYLGGLLTVHHEEPWGDIEARGHSWGIDRIFPPRTNPMVAIELLRSDTEHLRTGSG